MTRGIHRRHGQRGQAIVLFAIVLVGIIAFGGLLIDGGMAWSSRRAAQSAADTTALAAANTLATTGSPTDVAENIARTNGFPKSFTDCSGAPRTDGVVVHRPPISGRHTGVADYVEVVVTRRQVNTFAQVLGEDCWLLSARAVSYFKEAVVVTTTPAYGAAVLAGRQGCSDNSTLTVNGHNVTVNGDVISNGGGSWSGSNGVVNGSFTWVHKPPKPPKPSNCGDNVYNKPDVLPTAVTTYATYPEPYGSYTRTSLCTAEPGKILFDVGDKAVIDAGGSEYLIPGTQTLKEGVYCASGSKGSITVKTAGTRGNVTLVAANVTVSATNIQLTPYYNSLTVYADGTGSSQVNWSGSAGVWAGLIFAPNGNIHITGAGNVVAGAIWGDSIDFTGTGTTLSGLLLGSSTSTSTAGVPDVLLVE